MNGREYFHESVVKDIVDILTDLKDFDEVQFINNVNAKRSFKSITSATKDLILTFPVLVSTDIDPDNAIMIAKAQEKKMASLLHILFTAISVGNNEDVYDYVRKFHSNVGSLDGSLDSYSAALDKLATTFGESYDATLKIDHAVLESVLEDLRESEYVLPDNINESSLESYKVVPGYRTGYNDMIVQERTTLNEAKKDTYTPGDVARWKGYIGGFGLNPDSDWDDLKANVSALRNNISDPISDDEARSILSTYQRVKAVENPASNQIWNTIEKVGHGNTTVTTNSNNSYKVDSKLTSYETDTIERMNEIETELKNNKNLTSSQRTALQNELDIKKKSLEDFRNSRADQARLQSYTQRDNRPKAIQDKDMAEYMAKMADAHSKVVLNTEYKKANELQPTMMVVNFMKHTEEHGDYINTAVIGIKCKIYPISSSDIVNRISGKLRDKSFLTNFVRATTNEIGFFRDFLFAVDQAKFDAKSYGRQATSNKLWKVLERRGVKSKFRRSLKMYNDATAISTLVMSENDAEYLKKSESIDIMNVSRARKIMDEYNFLCLVVANQSTEVASFLYDTGDDTFEMIPFSGLEREASDNSYKKMVNLMAKISR